MKKGVLALLAIFVLLVSFAAAQVALPPAAPVSLQAEPAGKAIGLKADKSQCMCSADTLAKIEQIKKLLAELEQSCYAQPSAEEKPEAKPAGNCVDKCLAEQKPYCEGTCQKEGKDTPECVGLCMNAMKQKCENSCNLPAEGPSPAAVEEPGTEDYCVKSCEQSYAKCKNSCYATSGSDMPKLENCVKEQCMPLLQQCSASCTEQYGKKETFVQKVVNVFKPSLFKGAKWQCHDGTWEESTEVCKPSEDFSAKAKLACEGKCSAETKKCGVNTFMVYGEC